jgi:ligand-binding sensor domain-containing protein/two-component sensor histidine kinase
VRFLSRFKAYLLIVGLLINSKSGFADEILFSRLSANDGLFSNFINCVWQDQRGFLWIGSENGLQRYDGHKFIRMYGESLDKSIPILPVHQILGDKQDHMWIRMGEIIGQYDVRTNNFKRAITPKRNSGYLLSIDTKGRVIINNLEGIFIYNPKTNTFGKDKNIIDCPDDWGVITVTEDPVTDNFWICGRRGLGLFDIHTKKFYSHDYNPLHIGLLKATPSTDVMNLFIDSKHRYWIAQWPYRPGLTVNLYDAASQTLVNKMLEPDIPAYHEFGAFVESGNQIWAFGSNLLNIYDEGEKVLYKFYDSNNTNYGIKFTAVSSIYKDRDGNTWLATDNGLYKATVITHGISHGTLKMETGNITFVQQITGDKLIFGTWGADGIHTVNIFDSLKFSRNDELKANVDRNMPYADGVYGSAWCMIEHSVTHHLWFGCQEGALMDYDPVKKQTHFLYLPIFDKRTLRQVVEDGAHNLWFGTQWGRIIRLAPDGQFKIFEEYHSVVYKMMVDSKGKIWIGTTTKGLFVFDPVTGKTIKTYSAMGKAGQVLSKPGVKDIVQLNDSLMAIACDVNLDILNRYTGKIKQITPYQGLPNPVIYSMQTDNDGALWFSTNRNIIKYDWKKNEFRAYDQRDGLVSTTNNRNLLDLSTRLKSGRLIFAGGNNFVAFDPNVLKSKTVPKDVTITDIRLFNTYIRVDSVMYRGGLVLPHDKNSLTIEYASMTYTDRNRMVYYYMLEGAGKTWIRADNANIASFPSLPPGHYVFKVRCENTEGLASRHTTELSIYIRPAFWQTWWFILLLLILAAVPVYIIYNLRINRMAAVQRLREKVARDLHDDMGSTLTSINILSAMAANKITGENAPAREYLGKISTNSNQMMDAMDDIVWSIKPDNDTMPRIVARMREYAANVLEPKDIEYTVVNDDNIKNIKLDMDVRRNLFLIYKESLNNLVKYSGATDVSIEFFVHHGRLQLVVKDNGIGIDPKIIKPGNGLSNMKNRAAAIGGKLVVSSKPGDGTLITLEIPIT